MTAENLEVENLFSTHQAHMRKAIAQAKYAKEKDEVPIGAVIVHDNNVIASAHNQVEMLKDPTAHAEMIAITQASNALKCKWLHDCTLYVTIEPCSMCAGAIVLSRLKSVYFGASDPKAGGCGSVVNITQNNQLNHKVEVSPGLLEEECSALISRFFVNKRKVRKDIKASN